MISNFLQNEPINKELAVFFLKLDFAFASLLVYFWFIFCLNFPEPWKSLTRRKELLIFLPTIFFTILPFTDLVLINPSFNNKIISFEFGKLYFLYAFYIFIYLIAGSSISLILKYIKFDGLKKIQILYVLIGSTISASIAVIINIFLQNIINLELFRIGTYGIIFLIGFTSYAIITKRLFEIRVILTSLLVVLIAILLFLDLLIFTDIFWTKILKLFILIIFLVFGHSLVKSIIKEIKTREDMEKLAFDLEEANIELSRLSKAKSEFISIASHQLRTPLTAIKGYVSMILEGSYGKMPEKAKSRLENVFTSNERLIDLVNNLLSISRIESGKIKLEPEKASIEEIIDGVIFDLKINADKKKIALNFNKPKKPIPDILLDKDKIRQVILNLIDNAIKYTQEGSIDVMLEVLTRKLKIKIIDTGGGMEKEELTKLFQSFSRGTVGTKTHTEGAGLGLYIARLFVEMHKGKIWAESEGKGKGSTFYIELPIKE